MQQFTVMVKYSWGDKLQLQYDTFPYALRMAKGWLQYKKAVQIKLLNNKTGEIIWQVDNNRITHQVDFTPYF